MGGGGEWMPFCIKLRFVFLMLIIKVINCNNTTVRRRVDVISMHKKWMLTSVYIRKIRECSTVQNKMS